MTTQQVRKRGRGLRSVLVVVALAAAAILVPGTPALAAIPATLPALDSQGITATWQPVDTDGDAVPDMGQADMTTAQVHRPGVHTPTVRVRVWFPTDYQQSGVDPYQVLYLLHGGDGQFSDWSDPGKGALVSQVRDLGFRGLIVTPEGGRAGWYQDWAANTRGGFRPAWETFHVQQLVPWIDANFNTVENRSGRLVAGLSMGGYGALKYAVRHDDVFSTVASFSGGTTIKPEAAMNTIDQSLYLLGASVQGEGYPGDIFGVTWWDHQLPATWKEERLPLVFGPMSGWDEYDPQSRVPDYAVYENKLFLYAGTGEADLEAANKTFHDSLNANPGNPIDHRYCRGTGGHDWASWKTGLTHFLREVTDPAGTPDCPTGWQNV
ncbi:alpha/beta hydrolase [Thermomonospora umbrina]|uniref:S-formylglutathione hydrolase FrmB n=1 Tax=Thermomonospora umbrina TaxID=111806 RepID=A0A3D9SQZ6_9ACTN|nr:alpha/beta hydrolase family protein [Thermomonospora umbrina]REE95365.1 S-formylglutathione hydrolase FrmB [Thermomonospora umbrina]